MALSSTARRLEKKLTHYIGKAIADYRLLQDGDRVLVCLSGGKDSFTLLQLLEQQRIRYRGKFELHSYTLDQSQPGWDDSFLRAWLEDHRIPFTIERRDTYSVVMEKIPEGKTYCSLCSRLRRGNIYRFATQHGFNKIALGHHRDDLIESLLMSILYKGELASMPPKLLTDDKRHILIRPLAYCQEKDIAAYAHELRFPIMPCSLCGSQQNLARRRVKALISQLAADNPKVPSNILAALQNIEPSQLMDREHWNFRVLDDLCTGPTPPSGGTNGDPIRQARSAVVNLAK
jgi:tRNA 2-thiocytidine biosynthesis protein TtcA